MKNTIPLELKPSKREGVLIGMRKDGKKYSVREDRKRYFFPDEWNQFLKNIKPKKRMLYTFLVNTGPRIDEALHVKNQFPDIDFDRKSITLTVTKIRAKKGEHRPVRRSFSISSQFCTKLKKYIEKNNIKEGDYLFIDKKNPTKKDFKNRYSTAYQMMKRALARTNIKDWYNISIHNIRTTHGMWLKAWNISDSEIILRLGHDFKTYLKHYGSPSIFSRKDKMEISNILGDLYGIN